MEDRKDKVYRGAWESLEKKIEEKTSWGKIELQKLMQAILLDEAMRYV